jgi:kynurenine formamidase
MSRYVWLSYPLGTADPRPPAIPAPTLVPLYTLEVDGASVHTLTVASHTGTHVDAPAHVVENGVAITEFRPDELIFTAPEVIDLRVPDAHVVTPDDLRPWLHRMQHADIVLFRFGVGAIRREDPERFSLRSPGFGIPAAKWLRAHCPSLRAIGLDVPSLATIAALEETMAAHHVLLGGTGCRMLVIEDMRLEPHLTGVHEIRLAPWLVCGMDSSPCSVIGVCS